MVCVRAIVSLFARLSHTHTHTPVENTSPKVLGYGIIAGATLVKVPQVRAALFAARARRRRRRRTPQTT